MALKFVILSLIAAKPQSGYDIVKSFEHSVGHIWQASHQQVYRELGALAKQSWLEFEREVQEDKPDRKVYNITSLGLEKLESWIASSVDTPNHRSPILVRILALPVVGPELLISSVREAKETYEKKLSTYYALAEQYRKHAHLAPNNPQQLSLDLALRMAIALTEPMLKWCDETVESLENTSLSSARKMPSNV